MNNAYCYCQTQNQAERQKELSEYRESRVRELENELAVTKIKLDLSDTDYMALNGNYGALKDDLEAKLAKALETIADLEAERIENEATITKLETSLRVTKMQLHLANEDYRYVSTKHPKPNYEKAALALSKYMATDEDGEVFDCHYAEHIDDYRSGAIQVVNAALEV